MGTVQCVSAIFTKGDYYHRFLVCFLGKGSLFKVGSTLKGKNLLLEEQILSFKS